MQVAAAAIAIARNNMRVIEVAKTLVLNPAGDLLLLTRSQTDPQRPGEPDYPGGWPEPGESPAEGAARELHEEAGITVQVDELKLLYAGTTAYQDRDMSVNRFLFAVRIDNEQMAMVRLSDEHDAFQWLNPRNALEVFPHPFWGEGLRYVLEYKLLDI